MLIAIDTRHPEPRKIQRVVDALNGGQVVAYPTDTVYALACDVENRRAIDRLYELKQMDRREPLSFVCHGLSDIARYAIVENQHYRILKRHVPGPYCFILEATREVPRLVQTRRKTVGIRVPDHPVPHAILAALGRPVLSSGAIPKGEEALVDPADIVQRFKGVDIVLDGGAGGIVQSTVVDLTLGVPTVVRPGLGVPEPDWDMGEHDDIPRSLR